MSAILGTRSGIFKSIALPNGVTVDRHGKMPDVVFYFGEKFSLCLWNLSSVMPVDAKRHNELTELFACPNAGLVYVTAFPRRSVMREHLRNISWGTEVWCAGAQTHLIHFDGDQFLGPYESDRR